MKNIKEIASGDKYVPWETLAGSIDDNFTELNNGKIDKSSISQTIGTSTTAVMSQNVVSNNITTLQTNITALGEATKNELTKLESLFSTLGIETEKITLINGYNIKTNVSVNETVDLTPRKYENWGYAILDCNEGDTFCITGVGGDAPRLWAFVDSENKLIQAKEALNSVTVINELVIAPANSAKLIINSNNADIYAKRSFKYINNPINEINEGLNNLRYFCKIYGFDKTDILNWKLGYNINTGVSIGEVVDLSEREYVGWGYIISECTEGDIFVINGKGGVAPRLWAFVDSDNRLLSVASAVNSELQNVIVKAPPGSNKIIINSNKAALYNCGKVTDVLTKDIETLKETTSKIGTEVDNAVSRIENLEQSNSSGTYILENEADIINCYINGIKYKEDIENVIMNFAQSGIDKAVNVPSFVIIDNVVYATYFTNRTTGQEDTSKQIAVLAYADLTEKNITYIDVLNIGDEIEGYEVTGVNDIIAYKKSDTEILLSIAAYFNNDWHHVYSIFNVTTKTVGEIKTCKFYVGGGSVEFSKKNIKTILDSNDIEHLSLDAWGCVGLTPTLSTRIEDDSTYYYTSVFSDKFNGIVKSKDLIDWIFVATPYHLKDSVWESSVYVYDNTAYYFSRQNSNKRYGILTTYDLNKGSWGDIVYLNDSSSRGDFFVKDDNLYLVYAPNSRSYSCIMKIDKNSIAKSHNIQTAQFSYYSAIALPYVDVYNGTLYIIYNKSHTAINLSSIRIAPLSSDSVQTIFERLLLVE